jgi:hypothetical protein
MSAAKWCAVAIIGAGLLMILCQVGAQIAIDVGWTKKAVGSPSSYYIGLVVLLIGTVLMAVISLSGRARP